MSERESAALTSEEVEQRIDGMLTCYRQGDQGGVGLSFAEALEAALTAGDRRSEIYLCRCAGMVFAPDIALSWVSRSRLLARSYGLREEEAPALANLGVVHLELGELKAAHDRLKESLASLQGAARAVALSNLSLVVSRSDRHQALRLLASAVACAARRHGPAILSNQLALEAEEVPLRPPDFAPLAAAAAEDCAGPLFDVVLFNHVRALLEAGQPDKALIETEIRNAQEKDFRDGALGLGRWAHLRLEVLKALRLPASARLAAQARALDRSAERQVWLYRTPWALCPIPLAEPAVPSEREPV
jgi:tetratricopeptide (TPR) repeat protein